MGIANVLWRHSTFSRVVRGARRGLPRMNLAGWAHPPKSSGYSCGCRRAPDELHRGTTRTRLRGRRLGHGACAPAGSGAWAQCRRKPLCADAHRSAHTILCTGTPHGSRAKVSIELTTGLCASESRRRLRPVSRLLRNRVRTQRRGRGHGGLTVQVSDAHVGGEP